MARPARRPARPTAPVGIALLGTDGQPVMVWHLRGVYPSEVDRARHGRRRRRTSPSRSSSSPTKDSWMPRIHDMSDFPTGSAERRQRRRRRQRRAPAPSIGLSGASAGAEHRLRRRHRQPRHLDRHEPQDHRDDDADQLRLASTTTRRASRSLGSRRQQPTAAGAAVARRRRSRRPPPAQQPMLPGRHPLEITSRRCCPTS